MFRTFVAFRIAANPLLKHLHADLGELGRSVRPIPAENWHVTLKFLGETEEDLIVPIAKILQEVASQCEPFLVDLNGLGAFPNLRRPHVVWVGLRTEAELGGLVSTLERRLTELGFTPENRSFSPHLTVARLKGPAPRELATYVAQNEKTDYGSHVVESFALYQSELTKQGAQYTALSTVQL